MAAYFREHAWGSTTLQDLMDALSAASGRDLDAWREGWLETAGTDRLVLEIEEGGLSLVATPPQGRGPLPHRLLIGAYADRGDGLALVESLSVEVAGDRTPVETGADADLWLLNDDDQTFAVVRPDAASLELLLTRGGDLPTAVGRTLAVTTAWSMLYEGELTAQQFVDCGVHVLQRETADSVVEPLLARLVQAADRWAPLSTRDALLSQVADLCTSMAKDPGRRVAALRALADSATTPAQLELLAAEATEPDLRWRRLTRLAELDLLDESEVDALVAADPNPDAWMNALQARTARPTAEAKAEAWQAVVEDRRIPPGVISRVGRSFWRSGQEELLAPYAEKFLAALPRIGDAGMIWAMSLSFSFYPHVGGEDGFLDRLDAAAGGEGVSPVVRQTVRDLDDRRRRRDAARSEA
jgi:aminopeptidase N